MTTAPADRPHRRRRTRWALAAVAVILAALLPYAHFRIPGLFGGGLSSPGVLHLLSLMCVMAAVAIGYDLLFGYTGLLSFGHGLYVALGMYTTTIVLRDTELGLAGAIGWVLVLGIVVPLVLGAVCLRVTGIAFAMATLAFAQAAAIFVIRDPLRITGGEMGVPLPYQKLPDVLVGVFNAPYRYWLALATLVLTALLVGRALASRPGRVWRAVRDNPQRVTVLGLRPYSFTLLAFVLSSFLATLAGMSYVLVSGGAHAEVTDSTFTLGLLVMVVLGGTGRRLGALVGGLLYTYLSHRLGEIASAAPELPAPLREPMFVLGAVFVAVVLVLPGGVMSLLRPGEGTDVRTRLRRALSGRNSSPATKGQA